MNVLFCTYSTATKKDIVRFSVESFRKLFHTICTAAGFPSGAFSPKVRSNVRLREYHLVLDTCVLYNACLLALRYVCSPFLHAVDV